MNPNNRTDINTKVFLESVEQLAVIEKVMSSYSK